MQIKKIAAGLLGAALIAGGAAFALPATADSTTYDSWIEKDDFAPYATPDGLVTYMGASINFGRIISLEDERFDSLLPLAEVGELAYTVKDSTGYAPSYQLGIVSEQEHVTYARLVWEPYQQEPAKGPNTGTFTGLEKGLWWGNRVFVNGKGTSPFGNGEGSQSEPMPLSFFLGKYPDAKVAFFSIKQGSTTNVTSLVTSVKFDSRLVSLDTPVAAADVTRKLDAATKPLKDENAALQKDKSALQAELATYKKDVDATNAALVAADNAAKTAQAKLVSISGTEKVGKTVKVTFDTTVKGAKSAYQWYVGGKKVSKATKSSLKLSRSQAGKSLSVKVTTSWTDALGRKHSVTATAKHLRDAFIKR